MTSQCKSCGAPIIWCVTDGGKSMPVDASPVPRGNLVLDLTTDPPAVAVLSGYATGYVSHFATCPHAAKHREAKDMRCLISLRATGRTTRLLREAERLARAEGRAVYIIAANEAERRRLVGLVTPGLGIQVETPSSPGNFSWDTLRMRGAHPNCVVLIDHLAIEHTFSRVLCELHRFDDEHPTCPHADTHRRSRT